MDVIIQPAGNWVEMLLYFKDRRAVTKEELGIDIDTLLPKIQDKYCHVEITGNVYTFWNLQDWRTSQHKLAQDRALSQQRIEQFNKAKEAKKRILKTILHKLGLEGPLADGIVEQAKASDTLAQAIGISNEDLETVKKAKI